MIATGPARCNGPVAGILAMKPDEARSLLEQLLSGAVTVEQAMAGLRPAAAAELGFATVDLQRRERCGFPEVVYAEGKTCEWLEGVVRRLAEAGQDCLATRMSAEQADHLARVFPQATQDRVARTFWLPQSQSRATVGSVVVVTAGTSDLPVAREAVVTASALGCAATLIADVGVAGIHRVLNKRDVIAAADAIIVVAGMDGALPSVVGGLVDKPVIAVPTSVGYGAAFHGIAPLLTMLNACPANVAVVNIDAGFKAGYVAALIARRAAKAG
jgi:NCAIR mutase (PurE)-related protein